MPASMHCIALSWRSHVVNYVATTSHAPILDAQANIVRSGKDIPVTKKELVGNLAVCIESTSTAAEYKTCIDGFKVEKDALAKAAFGDADAKKLAAQTKQADRKTW